ncbi:VPA1262 family N-terminal domain-containing protein [Pseudomonas entomophila]|uniref:VPA1262 family N-terminal domain-containing protein n=1 Tax=Pseudomonas entomophila TaxID=312306 RepID=UPI0023D8B93B|nr:VPA1262 family N-terminal domain-containing protein [Pseudomonas entomophila]MDF0732171.1 VPA1262 family N-terminal domain-containing protein [Pseudomonas entomophila]
MPASPYNSAIIDGDYRHAVVQMVCLFHEKRCHLVFAAAQLLPAELCEPAKEEPTSFQARKMNGSRPRLIHQRYLMSADAALGWYQDCIDGRVRLLQGDATYQVHHDPLLQEPAWPHLVTLEKFAVTGDIDGPSRAHHLLPLESAALLSKLFESDPGAKDWFEAETRIDAYTHPELLGSVHLLLPDPILRSLKTRLHVAESGEEKTMIRFSTRANRSTQGLQVTLIEHRPTGIAALCTGEAQGPYLALAHAGASEKVELIIRCPTRGILFWQPPCHYTRQANVAVDVIGSQKAIEVPGKDSHAYTVPIHERVSQNTFRGAGGPNGIPAKLRKGQFDRQRVAEAERLGQKWLHRDRQGATTFVRSLIHKAQHRVWIIDPYFTTVELFSFAAATGRLHTQVMILTGGSTALAKPDETEPEKEVGETLLANISVEAMKHMKVRVMTGGMPTVHDRFLIIDDDVWFTGNSLNSIGERAGMMIKLPAPELVIEKIEALVNDNERTKDLAEWVRNRLAARPPAPSRFVRLWRWVRKFLCDACCGTPLKQAAAGENLEQVQGENRKERA